MPELTTLLSAALGAVAPHERIVCVEDDRLREGVFARVRIERCSALTLFGSVVSIHDASR